MIVVVWEWCCHDGAENMQGKDFDGFDICYSTQLHFGIDWYALTWPKEECPACKSLSKSAPTM